MNMGIRLFCLLLMFSAHVALVDEQIRQAQEELRRRNLYFGDVDGRANTDLATALKRYQMRKGFSPSGQIDETTANSLNIHVMTVAGAAPERLPDVPVLKSDTARELSADQRLALEQQAEQSDDDGPTPPPPAEEPPASQNLTPTRVTKLVEDYLRDGEGDSVEAQTRYFTYPVEYFDHGRVGNEFVRKDVANYLKRWPERKYTLTEPVTFVAAPNEGETMVEFVIDFHVRNKQHNASGRTRNYWVIRPEAEELKIVSIREQRLHER
jgi:hypothetical protein